MVSFSLTPERAEILSLRLGLRLALEDVAAVTKSRLLQISKVKRLTVQVKHLDGELEETRDLLSLRDERIKDLLEQLDEERSYRGVSEQMGTVHSATLQERIAEREAEVASLKKKQDELRVSALERPGPGSPGGNSSPIGSEVPGSSSPSPSSNPIPWALRPEGA